MCRWDRRRFEEEVISARLENECVHVIDVPPSYEAAIKSEHYPRLSELLTLPPPTYEAACSTEKLAQTSNSADPIHHI